MISSRTVSRLAEVKVLAGVVEKAQVLSVDGSDSSERLTGSSSSEHAFVLSVVDGV